MRQQIVIGNLLLPSHSPSGINTSALSSYITNRTYWGVFNKQTVSNNSSITFYLAIGLKKDKDLFINKTSIHIHDSKLYGKYDKP